MISEPHEAAAAILAPGSPRRPRQADHLPQLGEWLLRSSGKGTRTPQSGDRRRLPATISAGEWITASGESINDRTHGQQFKARFLKTSAPTSIDGIEKYFGSGMIRGIGPVYAKKLVRALGEKVFDTIEAEPERCAR